jgi:hypothetical protein
VLLVVVVVVVLVVGMMLLVVGVMVWRVPSHGNTGGGREG